MRDRRRLCHSPKNSMALNSSRREISGGHYHDLCRIAYLAAEIFEACRSVNTDSAAGRSDVSSANGSLLFKSS